MGNGPLSGVLAPKALLPGGWADDVAIRFAADGTIASVTPGSSLQDLPVAAGPVIPGMPNAHSHAFQRALVGRTQRVRTDDDFWSWRARMYELVRLLDPDSFEALTSSLYLDLLRSGYTSVAEFHYVHNDADGSPYADPSELSHRVLIAASDTGIGLTLLPVWYRWSGFKGLPVEGAARRFALDTDRYFSLLESLVEPCGLHGAGLGVAPHSIRAVGPDELAELGVWLRDKSVPVHIHISEQVAEVNGCLDAYGTSPIHWLLDQPLDVNAHWALVHATHATPDELSAMGERGATVVLCPTTEADLGDGMFDTDHWHAIGGQIAIGSDSQVSVSPAEELRLLVYGMRLNTRRRSLFGNTGMNGVGAYLWSRMAHDGARAIGQDAGRLQAGARADLLVLNGDSALFDACTADEAVDAFVLSGGADDLERVIAGGITRVFHGVHADGDSIRSARRTAMERLFV